MTIDTARLRELAMKATPGPWRYCITGLAGHQITPPPYSDIYGSYMFDADDAVIFGSTEVVPSGGVPSKNRTMRYIAALSPDVVIELLDRLEKAEAKP